MNKKCKIYRRYVCSHCLRTFLSEEKLQDPFCWKCGQGLEVIPKEENIEKINEIPDSIT